MESGNKKHRYDYSGMKGVVEKQKWGRSVARERYGRLDFEDGAPRPKDQSFPQFKEEQPSDKTFNDSRGWVRGAGENAENRPGYVHGYRGKR